jgi:pimeloyl-ACP methyl ester carboxylesterase
MTTTSRPTSLQALLLVPGLMCDAAVWAPLLPALAPHAQCHIVDHGMADNLGTMAEQLLATAPPTFALAGHSMGGRVALEVMRRAPERVTRLALLDTGYKAKAPGAAGEEEARKRYALLDIARTQGVRAMAQVWVQGMVAPERLGDAALIEAIVAMLARKSADVFAHQIQALLKRPDTMDVLATLRIPTLVACGQQDSWSPVSQHEEIASYIPVCPPVLTIAQAGHMATMERPVASAQLLLDWLLQPDPK